MNLLEQAPSRNLRRAASMEEFVLAPIGRYVTTTTALYWCYSPELCGSAHWGRPTMADLRDVMEFLRITHAVGMQTPFDMVVDTRALEAPDIGGYTGSFDALRGVLESLTRSVRRHAVVRPAGPAGGLVASVYTLIRPNDAWQVFDGAAEAFTWLEAGSAYQEVSALVATVAVPPTLVSRLRSELLQEMGRLDLDQTAKRLQVSRRTLQRVLTGNRTTFRAEREKIQVELARSFLRQSRTKIQAIAAELGYSSLPAFSKVFRRATGMSPREFRTASRAETMAPMTTMAASA